MTSYVLIEIADEGDVQKFIRETEHTVCALYRKPTQFCYCLEEGKRQANNGLVRGKKFGWWVCRICHKPPPGMPPAMRNRLEDRRPMTFFLSPYIFKAERDKPRGFVGWTTPMPKLELEDGEVV